MELKIASLKKLLQHQKKPKNMKHLNLSTKLSSTENRRTDTHLNISLNCSLKPHLKVSANLLHVSINHIPPETQEVSKTTISTQQQHVFQQRGLPEGQRETQAPQRCAGGGQNRMQKIGTRCEVVVCLFCTIEVVKHRKRDADRLWSKFH